MTRTELSSSTNTVGHVVVGSLDRGKPYSTATIANGFIFLSGLIPTAGAEEISTMTIEDQIGAVLNDLDVVLRACASSTGSIVKSTCYLVNADDFAVFNQIYGDFLVAPFPARTTVVTQLAAPGVLFEMDVVALVESDGPDGNVS